MKPRDVLAAVEDRLACGKLAPIAPGKIRACHAGSFGTGDGGGSEKILAYRSSP